MPLNDRRVRLSEMASAIIALLAVADQMEDTLVAAKLGDCLHCIETRIQNLDQCN